MKPAKIRALMKVSKENGYCDSEITKASQILRQVSSYDKSNALSEIETTGIQRPRPRDHYYLIITRYDTWSYILIASLCNVGLWLTKSIPDDHRKI